MARAKIAYGMVFNAIFMNERLNMKAISFWIILSLVTAITMSGFYFCSRKSVPQERVQEIHFMGSGPIEGPLEEVIAEFEKFSRAEHEINPDYPIYKVISGQTAARDRTQDPTRFLLSVVGGMPPDVVAFDRFALCQWTDIGSFEPLNSYIKQDHANLLAYKNNENCQKPWPGIDIGVDSVRREDYYAVAWNETVYTNPKTKEEDTYGIPLSIENRALLYNKDILIRHGFVDQNGQAKPPKTWAELREMSLKMTERDSANNITTVGFIPNYGNSWLYLYGWQAKGKFLSEDGKTILLNAPEIVTALDFVTQIYDELGGAKNVYAFQSNFQSGDFDPFLRGLVAMKIDGAWAVNNIAFSDNQIDFGVAPAPMPDVVDEPISWSSGWSYSIPATAKNKKGAWELIRFLSSKRAMEIYAKAESFRAEGLGRVYLPYQLPRKDNNQEVYQRFIAENPKLDKKFKDARNVFDQLLENSKCRPVTPVSQTLWQAQVDAMEEAIFHKRTSVEALDYHNSMVQHALDSRLIREEKSSSAAINWHYMVGFYLLIIVGVVASLWIFEVRRSRKKYAAKRNNLWYEGVMCALPWIIGFVVFSGGPVLFSVIISFCQYDILNPAVFNGLKNYQFMFTADTLFYTALKNTVYMVIGVPLGMIVGLGIAILLNQKVHGVAIWRSCFYIPVIVPAVASSLLFVWIFNPQSGLLNIMLSLVGISGPSWLQDESTSKIALIIMGLWTSGSGMIIWLAGLKGINRAYYEAASIDGASCWKQFIHITLPLLTPYIFFNFIIGIIGVFQIFTQAFIMTQGGPVNSTLFYAYHLFNQAFRYLNMGYAAALSWVLFAIVLALTLIQLKLSKRWVHYEE